MTKELFDKYRNVPENAKKPITAGRLKGMTDIKPIWRIEVLTELFGLCGIGWKTETIRKEIIEGANGEKIAIVDILLYYKLNDSWSEPIEGSGGSKFISKEQSGFYTSDECYKMAWTDALSVACRNLGIGADVYYGNGRSKYSNDSDTKEELKASQKQIEILQKNYTGDSMKKLLETNKIEKIEDMPMKKASELIGKLYDKKKEVNNE